MDNATEESIMDIIGKLKKIDYINPEDIPNIDLYILLRVSVWMTIKYLQKP